MTSEFPTIPTPPPRQKPWTAAMTGISHSYMAAKAAKHPRLAPIRASSPLAWISLMSTPAQNPRPSARTMTTRLSGTRPAASTASARANQPATSRALTGGWSMTTSAMPGCC